jgi:hypothetical protein
LKELLTSAPILNIVDPNEHFVVCTDACKEGLGGFLIQNGHERNYATRDLEISTIVNALKMWRHS